MIFSHLLPNSKAWRLTANKKLRQFFEGLTGVNDDIKTFFDLIWFDILPGTTRQLKQWESQFGLIDSGLTELERRNRLDATWKTTGGQSPHYIENTLQNAGFNVFVHEWWEPTFGGGGIGKVETAVYNSVSFNVQTQDLSVQSVTFNNDGLLMFIVGTSTDTVYQYDLSTAFDISTAVYNGGFFDVSTEELTPNDVIFNPDGLLMFVVGAVNDTVYRYDLSTAFDISTAVYNGNSFSVTLQQPGPHGVAFSSNGLLMFIVGTSNFTVHQYDLSTAFDVNTAVYNGDLFNQAEDAQLAGIKFDSTGTAMYLMGSISDTVYQYHLSTAFNITTAVYSGNSFNTQSQDSGMTGVTFNNDGSLMFISGFVTGSIYQYDLDTEGGEVLQPSTPGIKLCNTPRDPRLTIRDSSDEIIYTVAAGEALAQAGEALAQAGERSSLTGYLLVNKLSITTRDFLTSAGELLMSAGEAEAISGNFTEFKTTPLQYFIPDDNAKWPYFLYIGGENFGESAQIDAKRRDEFETLCLKICPAQQWLGIIAEFN